jgi:hypothetical protein
MQQSATTGVDAMCGCKLYLVFPPKDALDFPVTAIIVSSTLPNTADFDLFFRDATIMVPKKLFLFFFVTTCICFFGLAAFVVCAINK